MIVWIKMMHQDVKVIFSGITALLISHMLMLWTDTLSTSLTRSATLLTPRNRLEL